MIKTHQIDARKLWVKIGKPHKQFNKWAEDYIKPQIDENTFGEKSPKGQKPQIERFYEDTKGRPKTNYLLSRRVAAKLAMQANTKEGDQIREYFLDIEKIATQLYRVRIVRSDSLLSHDKTIYRSIISGEGGSKERAEKAQKRVREMLPKVLSGHGAGWWRDEFGKGIRDVLDNEDLIKYENAISLVARLFKGGMRDGKLIRSMVEANYGNSIDPEKYIKN